MLRLDYHFEPKYGWINDPNGLIFYKDRYHAFFQHNPLALVNGQKYWGHAVSDDLIHWDELPIALSPDMPYENSGGCYSGSAIEKDGRLYLFYTSVSKELGETQSMAYSDDGIHFTKYTQNPIIKKCPIDGAFDFRDPKVTKIGDKYQMVCGTGKNGAGMVLLFVSDNLYDWEYSGILYKDAQNGPVLECPDFFPFYGKYILMYSAMGQQMYSSKFIYGDFENGIFTPLSYYSPEAGPQFYAPQTFLDEKNRRIMIAWLYDWNKKLDAGADAAGALTIPRELTMSHDGMLQNYPVSEAYYLLKEQDELVYISDDYIKIQADNECFPLEYHGNIQSVAILRDTKTVEVFINNGQHSFSYWFAN